MIIIHSCYVRNINPEHHLHASYPVYDVISAEVKAAVGSPVCAHESFHDS